jgi:hypothetical protein
MRFRAVITEIFLYSVSFFEVRMIRAAFELIRKSPVEIHSLILLVIVGSTAWESRA